MKSNVLTVIASKFFLFVMVFILITGMLLTGCAENESGVIETDTTENTTVTAAQEEPEEALPAAEVPFTKYDPRYSPKIENKLVELYYAWVRGEADEFIKEKGFTSKDGKVFVTITSQPGRIEEVKTAALEADLVLLTEFEDYQDAWIPPGSLLSLANEESVRYMEIPIPPDTN